MLKIISSAVLASSFALTSAHEAAACGGGRCGGRTACMAPAAPNVQPAAPAAMPDMPDMAPAAPATAQGGTQRRRSYSYDTAPVIRAPQGPSSARSYSSGYNQFRADRKVRGLQ